MSYRDEGEEPAAGGFLKKLGAIIAAIVGFAIAKAIVSGGFDYVDRKTTTATRLEHSIQSNDELAHMYQPLKEYFPAEYQALVNRVAQMVRDGATQDEIYKYTFSYSREFVKTHSRDIGAAPSSTLAEIAAAHANIARALSAESPTACAQFGFEGLQADAASQLSPSISSQVKAAAPLMFKAAGEGISHPTKRSDELTETDAKALIHSVETQGLSPNETEMLFGTDAGSAAVPAKCRMTVALYGGVAALPEEQAARLMGFLLHAASEPGA